MMDSFILDGFRSLPRPRERKVYFFERRYDKHYREDGSREIKHRKANGRTELARTCLYMKAFWADADSHRWSPLHYRKPLGEGPFCFLILFTRAQRYAMAIARYYTSRSRLLCTLCRSYARQSVLALIVSV